MVETRSLLAPVLLHLKWLPISLLMSAGLTGCAWLSGLSSLELRSDNSETDAAVGGASTRASSESGTVTLGATSDSGTNRPSMSGSVGSGSVASGPAGSHSPADSSATRPVKDAGAGSCDAGNCEPISNCDCPAGSECIGDGELAHCETATCVLDGLAPCAVLPVNCGCPAHEQCQQVDSSGGTACVSLGDVPALGACGKDADCGLGLSCIGSRCKAYCDERSGCVEGACVAIVWDDAVDSAQSRGRFCPGQCDPLHPERDDARVSPCGAQDHCEPELGAPSAGASCYPASRRVSSIGDACASPGDCGAGAGCVCEGELDCSYFPGTCRAYCAESRDCAGNSRCIETRFAAGFCCQLPYSGAPCSITEQCGCESGEQCVAAPNNETRCAPRHGTPCTETTECGFRDVCVGSKCRSLCAASGESCARPDETCALSMLSDGTAAYACE